MGVGGYSPSRDIYGAYSISLKTKKFFLKKKEKIWSYKKICLSLRRENLRSNAFSLFGCVIYCFLYESGLQVA